MASRGSSAASCESLSVPPRLCENKNEPAVVRSRTEDLTEAQRHRVKEMHVNSIGTSSDRFPFRSNTSGKNSMKDGITRILCGEP